MKKVTPAMAIGLALLAVVVLVFVLFHFTKASDANGDNTLLPKPRPGSPFFPADPATIAASKSKGRTPPGH